MGSYVILTVIGAVIMLIGFLVGLYVGRKEFVE